MARPEFDLVVIGGGSGGLVVAAGGAALGAKVALVEKHKLGGDCLWTGCVPSKALIKSARIAHEMRHADRWALAPADPRPSLPRVMERVARVIAGIEPHDSPARFRGLGVDVVEGSGRFVARDAFDVNGRTLTAKNFVIATGSRAALPPIPGLHDVAFLTNETLFDLREPVPHLCVIGAGPIGTEMAQAFRRLGSEVTLVDAATQILPREDADLAAVVLARLRDEGVDDRLGVTVDGVARGGSATERVVVTVRDAKGTVTRIAASHLLIAAGRQPNIEGLDLEAAGVRVEKGRIVVDAALTTTNPRIRVAGDVAGGLQFTHVAEDHAGVVLRQTLFRLKWKKPATIVPWCTFTDPELARVGLSETEAGAQGIAHRVWRFAFDEIDRARADDETDGCAKLVTDPRGRILGAAIVGAHAGELIAECVLAMTHGMKAADLSAAIHAYPTLASINRRAADQRAKAGLTPVSRAWIQRLFGLRGA